MGRLLRAAVVLAVQLGSSEGYSFSIRWFSTAGKRQVHLRERNIKVCKVSRLKSTSTDATPAPSPPESNSRECEPALSRDSLPASRRRRVKGAIRRRARRLARLRAKNKARQDALALTPKEKVNDVAWVARSTYFPIRRGRRAAAAAAEVATVAESARVSERDTAGAGAGIRGDLAVGAETSAVTSPSYPDDDDEEQPSREKTATSDRRKRRKRATIKGRAIAKGGKDRGLWRSIFGPRPLLEVHTIEQLCQLVDEEGWGLEDLSVLTGGGRGIDVDVGDADSAGDSADESVGDALVLDQEESRDMPTGAMGSDDEGDGFAADDDVPLETNDASVPPFQQQREHPTVQAVLERAAAGTKPSQHGDGRRIGLAIEGGGMRGCVAAGMASCLHFLGLADSFDCVYGASAGSLIGAYFVSRQSNGTAVYHDVLPSADARFIDMSKFPQALGFELPKVSRRGPRGGSGEAGGGEELGALDTERAASFARVIGLDFLLHDVVGSVHALDFGAFNANDKWQPLNVVASGVSSMSTVSLASRKGHFSTLDELTGCIRASMLVPGLAGPLLSVPRRRKQLWGPGLSTEGGSASPESNTNNCSISTSNSFGVDCDSPGCNDETELLVDAMVFEPLPYRSAIEDGCTDVMVLCTRPKESQVLGKKPSIYETRVVRKFFEQHDDPSTTSGISEFLQKLRHLRIYAEDALVLDKGSRTGLPQAAPEGGPGGGRDAFLVAIAPDASCKEVSQLEMDRRAILQGCRDGFAACYDTFAGPAASMAAAAAGRNEVGMSDSGAGFVDGLLPRSGAEVALEYFPDSLLSIPVDLNATYFESGRFISDPRQHKASPPGPGASGTSSSGTVTAADTAVEDDDPNRKAVNGRLVGRGRALERLLRRRDGDEGAAAAAAAAAADVMEGADGSEPAEADASRSSKLNGSRGLLRRVLSRAKRRRLLKASSPNSSAAAAVADTDDASIVNAGATIDDASEIITATPAAAASDSAF